MRLAVMAHYDPRGEVGPHVRRHVEALAGSVEELVVVSTSALRAPAADWLRQRARLVVRPNYGYDFFSYKTGLDAAGDLGRFDEVVVCNDTYVGPLVDYPRIFATMARREVDFWGLTSSQRIRPHLQSFFVAFRPWVATSRAFRTFWGAMTPISERTKVIHQYEVGMTTTLAAAGFRWDTYYAETGADSRLARRRVAWWAALRVPPDDVGRRLSWWDQERRASWNPAIGLADVALDDGRLPYVKIDTLRYDPYGLNAARLLELCERRLPAAFDGVRGFLSDTAQFYPPRAQSALRTAPPYLRPLRPLVEYGHAV